MYFTNNNFFHGIMFHHFHDDKIHKKTQGSINQNEFYKLIKFVGRKNILDADDFFIKCKENKLTEKSVCFTFDDAIKSQYDIALPILEDLKIKSFFFVNSSLFGYEPDLLEIYRYFRTNYFLNIDEFYKSFFKKCKKNLNEFYKVEENTINQKKLKYPFYSISDVKFRLVRDVLLTKEEYKLIMFNMFKEKNFVPEKYYEFLFMSNKNIMEIKKMGHLIGLHSHSHPTLIEKMQQSEQVNEYEKNIDILSQILNCDKKEFKYMSHPCGSYNDSTLNILKKLGVELGFKNVMDIEIEKNMKKINNSFLEIARQDHSKIMKMIK